MSQPLPFETQNTHDDDGQVIDSFFIETDAPANLPDAQEPILVKFLPEPKPTTRIISGSFSFNQTDANAGNYAPMQILVPDANRQDLTIKVYSSATTVTDFVFIAGENGLLNSQSAGKLRAGSADFDLSGHTGSVYALPGNALTAAIEISWWATTV